MFSVHISFVTFWEARRFLGTGISNYSVWSRNCSWTPKVKRLDMNKSFSFAESVLAIAFDCRTEQLLPRSWVEPKAEGRLIRTRRNCQSATMVPRYNLSSLHVTFHGSASVLSVIKVFSPSNQQHGDKLSALKSSIKSFQAALGAAGRAAFEPSPKYGFGVRKHALSTCCKNFFWTLKMDSNHPPLQMPKHWMFWCITVLPFVS